MGVSWPRAIIIKHTHKKKKTSFILSKNNDWPILVFGRTVRVTESFFGLPDRLKLPYFNFIGSILLHDLLSLVTQWCLCSGRFPGVVPPSKLQGDLAGKIVWYPLDFQPAFPSELAQLMSRSIAY